MAADIKEKINLDIESLQDQLEEFHRTNVNKKKDMAFLFSLNF